MSAAYRFQVQVSAPRALTTAEQVVLNHRLVQSVTSMASRLGTTLGVDLTIAGHSTDLGLDPLVVEERPEEHLDYADLQAAFDVIRRTLSAKDEVVASTQTGEGDVFVCPACDTTNRAAMDVMNRYCGRCHWFTGEPTLAGAIPALFTRHNKIPPTFPVTFAVAR